jgi:hypothetical protein
MKQSILSEIFFRKEITINYNRIVPIYANFSEKLEFLYENLEDFRVKRVSFIFKIFSLPFWKNYLFDKWYPNKLFNEREP